MLALYSSAFISFASMPSSHSSCPDNSISDPPIPGVLQGKGSGQGHVLLGWAPDYPPYTQFTATSPKDLGGFSVEIGHALEAVCGVKVEFILDSWSECWTTKPDRITSEVNEYVGEGIANGRVHGCTGYTHSKGERSLSLEFTHSILGKLKTAGILTRLDNGVPVVSPMTTDYTNIKVGDVSGWAPTSDTFGFNFNYCDDGNQFLPPANGTIEPKDGDGNPSAIKGLLDGEYDALYIYADQLYNFVNSNDPNAEGFGTTFAYIHTGLDQWSFNGTTLAISKRGSGLKQVLDPCIAALVETQIYQDICTKHFDASSCINNPAAASGSLFYDNKMNERTDTYACADGYCTCSAPSV